jgi:class 3 adenylate cyclase/TolB-like protein
MARRLAAILAADIVGYSRLMAADEAGTHARLKALRQDLIEPKITEHHGRVVKLMGDGALVEFASVVDAVQCAVEIQQEMAERNAGVPDDQRLQFRLGVNLGDVIIEGDDIYGDGVNVAARLEALAEPGGVCVSAPVRVQVEDKLPYGFDDLGEQQVKNIPRPVHVFRVVPDGRGAPSAAGRGRLKSTRRLWPAATAAVALLLGVAGAWLWLSQERAAPAPQQAAIQATPATTLAVAPQAPLNKYRIAVLPFVNMSADAENEYFSDGITEELISKLSRLHDLTVIARTSIMQYKGTGKGIPEIGRELQAGTILEGSVRNSAGSSASTSRPIRSISAAVGGRAPAHSDGPRLAMVMRPAAPATSRGNGAGRACGRDPATPGKSTECHRSHFDVHGRQRCLRFHDRAPLVTTMSRYPTRFNGDDRSAVAS